MSGRAAVRIWLATAVLCCVGWGQRFEVREQVSVSAEPVPAETLAGTHTVLDREAIERTGARDMAELLRIVGVVHLSQAGTKGALSTVSIRAAKPNFTLVLVNGVPVNDIGDLLGGAFNFATVDVADVERIDILRGPLSSVYGSEAVGGVISVVLRRAGEGPGVWGTVEGGNFGFARGAAGVKFGTRRAGMSADGSFARMGEQVFGDGYVLGMAGVKGRVRSGAAKQVESFVRWNRLGTTGFPVSSGGAEYALSRKLEVDQADQVVGGVGFEQVVGAKGLYSVGYDLFSRVALGDAPAILDKIPPGKAYVPSVKSDSRFLRQRAMGVVRWQGTKWLALDGVASIRHEAGTTVGKVAGTLPGSYRLMRPTGFFSVNGTVAGKGFSVTGGTGVEKSNVFHTVLSPRVGVSYGRGEFRVRGSWGKGYKLPSFYALGNPLVGSAKLTPEFATSWDAGAEMRRGERHVVLSVFSNQYRDLIDFSPALFKLVNRSTAFGRGVELEGGTKMRGMEIGGAVSYVDAGLRGTADRLRDVPRWTEDLHVTVPVGRSVEASVSTVWVGRRFDYQVPVPARKTVGAYSVTNLNVRYKVREGVEGFVRVENLFDRKYEEFVGFRSAGVYVSAGLTYRRKPRRSAP